MKSYINKVESVSQGKIFGIVYLVGYDISQFNSIAYNLSINISIESDVVWYGTSLSFNNLLLIRIKDTNKFMFITNDVRVGGARFNDVKLREEFDINKEDGFIKILKDKIIDYIKSIPDEKTLPDCKLFSLVYKIETNEIVIEEA